MSIRRGSLSQVFYVLDTDGDGFISQIEFNLFITAPIGLEDYPFPIR